MTTNDRYQWPAADAIECRAEKLTVGDLLIDGPQPAHVTAIHMLTDVATGRGFVRITARCHDSYSDDSYSDSDDFTVIQRTTRRLIAHHDDGSDVDIDTDAICDIDTVADMYDTAAADDDRFGPRSLEALW
ncbi:hypothetical protein [Gordonia amicalis]|uniref:Uncharacterized protein n=1 Tax=Gordonia amicalis TaxID=89053 RepID=A0ABU4DK15_9ACTN|nr:hypothetical protein [Gordonia amicalis]MDV6310000.1 hypothetical protein [Gordonia amicalis]